MAISTDTVYQKVLALANKEQRGYITPQEFNLFANMAQREILDQYFYDLNQFARYDGNNTEYSDMVNLLDEKLSYFKESASYSTSSGKIAFAADNGNKYRLGSVIHNDAGTHHLAYEVNKNDFIKLNEGNWSSLTKPTRWRPIFYQERDVGAGGVNIWVSHGDTGVFNAIIDFIVKPFDVKWGYVVINEKAIYDPANTTNFKLHPMEESELVYKILTLAGITLNKPALAQSALNLQGTREQQEKQ